MKEVAGGITAVPGILAAGIAAGIKKTGLLDLALIVSIQEAMLAGVFTRNRVAAAPVVLTRRRLRRGRGRAILANSGNANACTGPQGLADAAEMARVAAENLHCAPNEVLVGSTGVIGKPLPMDRIRRAVPALVSKLSRQGGMDAAKAIMTTDTIVKLTAVQERIGGRTVTLGGIAKGSGMIHPNMATMLAYLATDANIEQRALQRSLGTAIAQSFNRIPLDGDTSTNDMVLCLANGMAGNRPIVEGGAEFGRFQVLLTNACLELAQAIARDAEGATKLVRLIVKGARTEGQALHLANTIATSSLVKTAWFGEDANWGRIMAAIGRAGVRITENKIAIHYGDIPVVRHGEGLGAEAEQKANRVLKDREFELRVDLGSGPASVTVWTSDLTAEYVKINASYRS
jgi:glutamate N-acetyltransferase/amino-acid N-acetyltransferase